MPSISGSLVGQVEGALNAELIPVVLPGTSGTVPGYAGLNTTITNGGTIGGTNPISGGNAVTSGNGVNLTLRGGITTASAGSGGAVIISGADGGTAGTGGNISLVVGGGTATGHLFVTNVGTSAGPSGTVYADSVTHALTLVP